jgi:hypothetical protein
MPVHFDKRVLKMVFGPKRVEVIGEWKSLHNDESYGHSLPNVIRVIK